MKLALCLQYPISMRGGVSVLVEVLAVELSRQGCEIVLVSPDSSTTISESVIGRSISAHVEWHPVGESRATARELATRLAQLKVELAHFHGGSNFGWGNRFIGQCPVVYLHQKGIPSIYTSHLVVSLLEGYCARHRPAWYKTMMLPLVWCGKMQQLRNVRHEVAVSQHDYGKLRRWYAPLAGRFVQIYHSRLRGQPPRVTAPREKVILNVGHMAWRKGQLVLAEAFMELAPRYPGWKLQFAGQDGGEGIADKIRELGKTRGLADRIELLGERQDAMDLMQRASIYVQPSYWEALGLALQEAAFCGCPVIGSRAGGIPELIQEGRTGLLFEPGHVKQLGLALEELMGNESRRDELGRAGAASILARGMTVEAMVKKHLELYESTLAQG